MELNKVLKYVPIIVLNLIELYSTQAHVWHKTVCKGHQKKHPSFFNSRVEVHSMQCWSCCNSCTLCWASIDLVWGILCLLKKTKSMENKWKVLHPPHEFWHSLHRQNAELSTPISIQFRQFFTTVIFINFWKQQLLRCWFASCKE